MLAEASLLDQLLGPIIAAAAAGIAGTIFLLFQKLNKKLGLQLKAEEEKAVQEAIERAVLKTMQTFVDTAKKGAADGKLSKEDALEALKKTKEEALAQLQSLGKIANGTAKKCVEDEKELEARIEAAIPVVKAKTTMAAKGLSIEEAKKIVEGMKGESTAG